MRRLTLLLLALSLAVVAPVAHAAPAERGGPTAHAAQLPGDRDGDGTPDASDLCPDTPGGFNGCPQPPNGAGGNVGQAPADRDHDGTPDASDSCPDTPGGFQGCPPPSDRDGDAIPDSSDRCPDERGVGNLGGCPGGKSSIDGDGDGTLNAADACPDMVGKQANGCDPFVVRYFFGTQGLTQFAADKANDTTYCSGGPLKCKTTHVTYTLSAQSAKAAGTKRLIGSISVANPTMGFRRGISRATAKKLARLKKITVTIHAWFTLTTGQKIETPQKTFTISKHGYAAHQFNNTGTTGPEEL